MVSPEKNEIKEILDDPSLLLNGDRRALAQAITLIESSRDDHRDVAEGLLNKIMPNTGESIRVGISGPPGVGKSTFIEAFGQVVIGHGKKISVLAVDPSSSRSGGSILGDRTRMPELSRSKDAFIRPSPSGMALGGVARRTREAMLLCEAAGFEVIFIETVGVGQSEHAVSDMVDMFILLTQPGGGDDLQGIKRGVVELADLVVVTKSDGELEKVSLQTQADYAAGLSLLRDKSTFWSPKVLRCSAQSGVGIEMIWEEIKSFKEKSHKTGDLEAKRRHQSVAWMWREVQSMSILRLKNEAKLARLSEELEQAVGQGLIEPGTAARKILNTFFQGQL